LLSYNIASFVWQHEKIAHSSYSKALCQGAKVVPYTTFSSALDSLADMCCNSKHTPFYSFIYLADIDSVGHRNGITSDLFSCTVSNCWKFIETNFWQPICRSGKRIAVLFTADHGMSPVEPDKTLYINKTYPAILPAMKKDFQGRMLAPAGSCRDLFLHIQEEKLAETTEFLCKVLEGRAEVISSKKLIKEGFFGSNSQRLQQRLGNVVILPYFNEAIWWFEKKRFEQHFVAAHGGLSSQEMESICLFLSVENRPNATRLRSMSK
jgi:predicted AlkP superfamily pyrophosphatase or phosphodiesterase